MTQPSLADCTINYPTKSPANEWRGSPLSAREHRHNRPTSFPPAGEINLQARQARGANRREDSKESRVDFKGGTNLAMKVPSGQWEETVAFYRDVLGLTVEHETDGSLIAFAFGAMSLWLHRTEELAQAEIWLEVTTDDAKGAERHLTESGINRCNYPGTIRPDFGGFWVMSPTGNVHLVCRD
jgi:catechol 2,3-dioxygenase-like lactoylglutathione lyase family enzyme